MNEQFEQWWQAFDATPRQSILGLKTAAWEGWKARGEIMKPKEQRFGCFVDIDEDPPLLRYDCVLDADYVGNGVEDCFDAKRLLKQGKSKTSCKFWRPIDE